MQDQNINIFPYEPYLQQKKLMNKIYSTINSNKIGIFESPTGTGKSLSLLCASLQWILNHSPEFSNNHKKSSSNSSDIEDINTSLPDWVNDYHIDSDFDKEEEFTNPPKKFKSHKIKNSKEKFTKDIRNTLPNTQIIYTSRTHSQLSQLVSEIRKIKFPKKLKCVSLGSRKNLCINSDITKLKSSSLINDACLNLQDQSKKSKEKGCMFLKEDSINNISNQCLNSDIKSISELKSLGIELGGCPYYGCRNSMEYSHILLVPYNYILHHNTRNSLNINLKDKIIIIDEAHNLTESFNMMHSCLLKNDDLDLAKLSLNKYYLKYNRKLSPLNGRFIRQILNIINKIHIFLIQYNSKRSKKVYKYEQNKIFVLEITEFELIAKLESINLFPLLNFIKKFDLVRKMRGFSKWLIDKDKKNNELISSFQKLFDFLFSIAHFSDEGKIFVNPFDMSSNKRYIKFVMFDITKLFSKIMKDAKSVILIGGTMKPFDYYLENITKHISQNKIELFSCGHIINFNQLIAISVGNGINGELYDFSYKNKNNSKMIMSLGKSVIELCSVVPSGIIVFFSSFNYLQFVINLWKFSDIFNKIISKKVAFCETNNIEETNMVLNRYVRCIKKTSKGAILFCVFGAKMSEGLNFANDLSRCVIAVGLPFPNIKNPELIEKINYLNEQKDKSGNRYYQHLCMRLINQSIGRAIRSKDDYSSIILFDYRFRQKRIIDDLPGWIVNRLYDAKNLKHLIDLVDKFFDDINK